MERALDGFSLRIENTVFQRDKNFNSHKAQFQNAGGLVKYPAKDKINITQMMLNTPNGFNLLSR
jgi:hypothetical protein